MSQITELRRYAETKEYKTIVAKCKNRQENKTEKVLELYKDGVAKEHSEIIYSNHDVNGQRKVFTLARLDEIKSTSEGAKILKTDMIEEIERAKVFLTLGIRDQYGITNSAPIFDDIDVMRCDIQDNRYFQTKIEGMIAALEKEEEAKPSLTENDPD